MSLKEKFTNLLAPGSPAGLDYFDLLSRKAAAEAAIAEAERLYRGACLSAEQGESGAIERKVEATGALELARQRLRDVESALFEFDAIKAQREREANAATLERQWDLVAKAAKARARAADVIQRACTDLALGHKALRDATDDLLRALPHGHGLDTTGARLNPDALTTALATELARLNVALPSTASLAALMDRGKTHPTFTETYEDAHRYINAARGKGRPHKQPAADTAPAKPAPVAAPAAREPAMAGTRERLSAPRKPGERRQ